MEHPTAPSGRPAIFVTGASSGIGRASAELFARQGWFVGLYDIDGIGVSALSKSLGKGNSAHGVLDVRCPQNWQQALTHFWSQSGHRLDVLFNNAGILSTGPLAEVALDKHAAMVGVNLTAVIYGCHTAFPYLCQTPHSRVINMSSATGLYGQPELATYSATKFAVRGLTEALDIEWRKIGIKVSDVAPGFVKTQMAEDFSHLRSARAAGVRLTPDQVALTIWKCATSRRRLHKTHWTVGRQALSLSLALRFMPTALTRWIVAGMAS
jgi:NAD(P)-dependent dehydrogenase (short-subunit alcohol dehydrogenase family)